MLLSFGIKAILCRYFRGVLYSIGDDDSSEISENRAECKGLHSSHCVVFILFDDN